MNAFWGALIGLGVMLLFGFLGFCAWSVKCRIGVGITATLSIAGLTLCVISGIVLDELDSRGEFNVTKIEETTPLVSVYSDQYISGGGGAARFVITTNDVYRYYYEIDGGIRQGAVSAGETTIYYANEEPRLVKVSKHTEVYYERWFLYADNGWWSTYYELYVPEGSVATQFKFD